jgi:hypothetical protein
MINYEYTEVNRLEKPHKYMYTAYIGSEFVSAYFSDRLKNIRRFQMQESKCSNITDLYFCSLASMQLTSFLDNSFDQSDESWKSLVSWQDLGDIQEDAVIGTLIGDMKNISSFNIENEIDTEKLLHSLISIQLNAGNEKLIKVWLDRLVQRFEVTKKIYEIYPAGFRKGKGVTDIVRLYWLFALALALYYANTRNIKYLSALLKVSDLLCSLDDECLVDKIPSQGLSLILSVEVLSIKLLSNNLKEIPFVFE